MAVLPTIHKANQPIAHMLGMRVTFGKHKGKDVETILATDPHWLVWAHENVEWFRLEEPLYREAIRLDLRDRVRYSTGRNNPNYAPRYESQFDEELDGELQTLNGILDWGNDD